MLFRRSLVFLGLAAALPLLASPAAAISVEVLAAGPFDTPASVTSSTVAVPVNAVSTDAVSPAIERAKRGGPAWAFPVRKDTPISGTFGERGPYWPGGHAGIDFDGDLDDPVFAAIGGRVVSAGFNTGGYGNLVITRRGDGTHVRYAHLAKIAVAEGERVRAGQRIGRMGATGQVTGVHLHLEVRINDGVTPTNPAALWSGQRPGVPAKAPAWACAKYGGCA